MSKNLSKIKRDKMLETIAKIKESISDDETLKNLSLIEYELTKKKYGLIWEEHEEKVDEELKTKIPTFEEVKDNEIFCNKDEKFNFLLEGDNLHSLYLLEKTHKGKIDIIYIDPPYNTGNKDFMYDDNFIDDNDSYKHSKWLSFMKRRLEIAKRLLKKNGVIFISIDKNECYQLKLLMDEIFGEEAFVADLHIETSIIGGPRRIPAMAGSIVKTCEFVLGYVNGNETKIIKQPKYDFISGFDSHYSLFFDKTNDILVPFLTILKNNEHIKEIFNKMGMKISLLNLGKIINTFDEIKQWLYSDEIAGNLFRKGDEKIEVDEEFLKQAKRNTLLKYNEMYITIDDNNNVKNLFRYKERIGQCDDYYLNYGERCIRGNLWKGFSADGGNLAKEGNVSFKSGKKPVRLIEQLIETVSRNEDKDTIVLDFFAGSGTTAEAVLKLNLADGGSRRFILCTNNENNICQEVTYKRLSNVVAGYGKNKPIKANIKYYKTSYVPRINTEEENIQENLLFNIKNLIQLENGINIDDERIKVILAEEEVDKFSLNIEDVKKCERLYISSDILLTAKQTKTFKDNGVEVYIIPEYYFENEIREVQ